MSWIEAATLRKQPWNQTCELHKQKLIIRYLIFVGLHGSDYIHKRAKGMWCCQSAAIRQLESWAILRMTETSCWLSDSFLPQWGEGEKEMETDKEQRRLVPAGQVTKVTVHKQILNLPYQFVPSFWLLLLAPELYHAAISVGWLEAKRMEQKCCLLSLWPKYLFLFFPQVTCASLCFVWITALAIFCALTNN